MPAVRNIRQAAVASPASAAALLAGTAFGCVREGGVRHIGSVLNGVLYRIFSKMPRDRLKALLLSPHFDADQRAYWFYIFNLKGE
jgi:hypothetical protein